MKHILTVITLFFVNIIVSQTKADDLLGTYMTDKNDAKIEIVKRQAKYYGILVWTNTPGKLDTNNKVPEKRTEKIVGKEILTDFVFDGSNVWHNGTIYNPESGEISGSKISRDNAGNLSVRSLKGLFGAGKTVLWIKIKP